MKESQPILRVTGLSVSRRDREGAATPLLSRIEVSVRRREIVGVVGVSGSGKSLMTMAILGLLPVPPLELSGSILLNGDELLGMSEANLWRRRGSQMSLIVSNARSRLNPLLPVGEQIALAIREKRDVSQTQARTEALALLTSVGMADPSRRMRALPFELSGGMCQRVVIAMGICNEPSLMIADEPTSGLDVTIQTQVLVLIREIIERREAGMLLMTRDLGVVAHFCDRVVVLQSGRVAEAASVREFFRHPQHPHSRFLLDAAFGARAATDSNRALDSV